jgi:diguanylate cyclase (GGDEF)-like protein/PAS domain S-box-containing protein
MGKKSTGGRSETSKAARDLAIMAVIALAALVVVRFLNVSGRMDELVQRVGMMGLHDVFVTSLILLIALSVYSLRRWKESRAEIERRIHAEELLQKHQEELEDTVEERTAELRKINEELEDEIAERRQAEDAVRQSETFLSTIFHSIRDPFSIIDREYRIIRVNDAYVQMRGKSQEDLIGARCHEILREKDAVCKDCVVEKTFISGDPCAKEKLFTLNGGDTWVEILTYPISDGEGNVSHVVEYIRDITGRKMSDEENVLLIKKLEHISRTDALTSLLNRRAIIRELRSEVERAKRYRSSVSMLLCDIDYFKEANDAYGHEAGDKALVHVANMLADMGRGSDSVGRYGGDEFMLVLPQTELEGAMEIAGRALSAIKNTQVRLADGRAFNVTLSIGVTAFDLEGDDTESIIRRADKAMYASKRAGRNKITVKKAGSLA